ncbi:MULTISPECIES: Crp/Fnr family transcriptional regulator [Myroides]|uniref:Cyclic nucleotide-binding domain-containing protein n=1 Tax=Myroides albus TaxID=2562892 RepID=A0A6I3LRU9_9FLAO|nr:MULTISPECIES: Crp/Fnr family transcriptional regulator [Myroides]MTG99421.1 cyclic nucleotide-binding domain-containing protein [Myroides albus]MVX35932.1 cyclic nucleotide-binding domain-containing protein [Myroides sp. LoEW2-1]UVD80421.1 Crp/Fnr family transcriptional regulator [Myroides albus]
MLMLEAFFTESSRESYKCKVIVLKEGMIANRIGLIKKGGLRMFLDKDGEEVTFQFMFEGSLISSFESFWTGEPSAYSVETIEETEIYWIEKEVFESILSDNQSLKIAFQDYIINRMLAYQRLFLSRIKYSPEERYKQLQTLSPELLQRVPQHYIASYLGITAVSLSRIRNRR